MSNVDYRFNKIRQIQLRLDKKKKELDLIERKIQIFIDRLEKFRRGKTKEGKILYLKRRTIE